MVMTVAVMEDSCGNGGGGGDRWRVAMRNVKLSKNQEECDCQW